MDNSVVLNCRKEKKSYTWSNVIVPVTERGWSRSADVSSLCTFHDCSVYLLVRRCKPDNMVDISIQKSLPDSVKAEITLRIVCCDVNETIGLDNWKKSCDFLQITKLVGNVTVFRQIECDVVWMMFLDTSEKFMGFLFNKAFSDVSIVIGKEELPAHKVILSANSSVFKTMLSSEMKEAKENRIVVTDVDIDIMKIALIYFYTGMCKPLSTVQCALDVLNISEKYDVSSLKRICELELTDKLTITNVLEILDKADDFHCDILKDKCFKFMTTARKEITSMDNFSTLCVAKPRLMVDFVRNVINLY